MLLVLHYRQHFNKCHFDMIHQQVVFSQESSGATCCQAQNIITACLGGHL